MSKSRNEPDFRCLVRYLTSVQFRGIHRQSVNVFCGSNLLEENVTGLTIFGRLFPTQIYFESMSKRQVLYKVKTLDLEKKCAQVEVHHGSSASEYLPEFRFRIRREGNAETRVVPIIIHGIRLELHLAYEMCHIDQTLVCVDKHAWCAVWFLWFFVFFLF